MIPEEREALARILEALNATNALAVALMTRVERLEQVCTRLHYRLQLQECGTALYEVANDLNRRGH